MKSIWKWFRGDRGSATLLKGAPIHARTKTYSAETGYVYQYVFRGYRQLPSPGRTEFVFEASHDRKEHFDVVIELLASALAECSGHIGREVLGREQYALAKMTLFRAFDELDPRNPTGVLAPNAAEMEAQLRALDRI